MSDLRNLFLKKASKKTDTVTTAAWGEVTIQPLPASAVDQLRELRALLPQRGDQSDDGPPTTDEIKQAGMKLLADGKAQVVIDLAAHVVASCVIDPETYERVFKDEDAHIFESADMGLFTGTLLPIYTAAMALSTAEAGKTSKNGLAAAQG